MGKKEFYLFLRNGVYYCQLVNPETGKRMTAKSTGTSKESEAQYIALKWIHEGVPEKEAGRVRKLKEAAGADAILHDLKNLDSFTEEDVEKFLTFFQRAGFIDKTRTTNKNQISFVDFALEFWDYENSPYIQEKILKGRKITRGYCQSRQSIIRRHYKPFFKNMKLTNVDREKLKKFSEFLAKQRIQPKSKKQDKDAAPLPLLSGSTKNHILKAGIKPLRYAFAEGMIHENITVDFMLFSGKSRLRGILSDKEVEKLFSPAADWGGNEGARLGNLLAMQTGLRAGEILALQVRDILEDRLDVVHSWSRSDGLKSTKTNEARQVPILPETRRALLDYAKKGPFEYGPNTFIFTQIPRNGKKNNAPTTKEHFSNWLQKALESVGVKREEQKSRGICFHSWRHYYARKMADVLDERAARLTGHKTPAMFEHYANHAAEEDFQKAIAANTRVFGQVHDIDDGRKAK